MTVQTAFKVPDTDASRDEIEAALEAMNAIPLTIGQCERGYAAWLDGAEWIPGDDSCLRYEADRWATLVKFAADEGLAPPDVAAAAIYFRYRFVMDALDHDYDIKAEDPAAYPGLATWPLRDGFVGIYPAQPADWEA